MICAFNVQDVEFIEEEIDIGCCASKFAVAAVEPFSSDWNPVYECMPVGQDQVRMSKKFFWTVHCCGILIAMGPDGHEPKEIERYIKLFLTKVHQVDKELLEHAATIEIASTSKKKKNDLAIRCYVRHLIS